MKRDSFIVYRSFYEAIKDLPEKNQLEVWNAITEFSLNFTEIELTGLSKTIFGLIKPNLQANNSRWKNGKTPKEISKTEAKGKQEISKTEANKDKDKDKDKKEKEKAGDFANAIPLTGIELWNTFPLPPSKKQGADLTKEEIIALVRIPFGKRTQDQNRQVGQFTTSHPAFDTDAYTKDIY